MEFFTCSKFLKKHFEISTFELYRGSFAKMLRKSTIRIFNIYNFAIAKFIKVCYNITINFFNVGLNNDIEGYLTATAEF